MKSTKIRARTVRPGARIRVDFCWHSGTNFCTRLPEHKTCKSDVNTTCLYRISDNSHVINRIKTTHPYYRSLVFVHDLHSAHAHISVRGRCQLFSAAFTHLSFFFETKNKTTHHFAFGNDQIDSTPIAFFSKWRLIFAVLIYFHIKTVVISV